MENLFNMFSSTLDLRHACQEGHDIFAKDMIGNKKKVNQIISAAKKNAKSDECLYCGKKVTSLCNSHTIPAFILNNISVEGNLYNFNKMIGSPLIKDEDGVNRSGTFYVICRNCDGKVFADYENPSEYTSKPTNKMLAQIAMKNFLKNIYKRKLEREMYKIINEQIGLPMGFMEHQSQIIELDSNEFLNGYLRAKKADINNSSDVYYMFFCQRLDYVVPIAFQGPIAMTTDLEGGIINNLFKMDPQYKLQELHICIFPFNDESLIFMFIDSKSKRYRRFYKQFRKLSLEEQLRVVVYLLFAYTEDFFIHKDLSDEVLNNEVLLGISGKSPIVTSATPFVDGDKIVQQSYDFSQLSQVPNILWRDYMVY
jgi:hypothetical protein